jgi:hypothetical protein
MSFSVLKKVELKNHHYRPGRTKHSHTDGKNMTEFPPFVSLKIAQHPGDSGFYLLHIPEKGMVADTWHNDIEEALHQAEYEFDVKPDEWQDVNEQF